MYGIIAIIITCLSLASALYVLFPLAYSIPRCDLLRSLVTDCARRYCFFRDHHVSTSAILMCLLRRCMSFIFYFVNLLSSAICIYLRLFITDWARHHCFVCNIITCLALYVFFFSALRTDIFFRDVLLLALYLLQTVHGVTAYCYDHARVLTFAVCLLISAACFYLSAFYSAHYTPSASACVFMFVLHLHVCLLLRYVIAYFVNALVRATRF